VPPTHATHYNPPPNPTTNPHTSTTHYQPILVNMSLNSNLPPTCKHVLLRDRPAHAHTVDHYNPRSRLAGHPLAPFNTVPQPPPAAQNLGTALKPSVGKGLQTPLVLAAPMSTTDMGRAVDLSTRTVDRYRGGRPAPSHNKVLFSTQRPLPIAHANTLVNNALNLIPFSHPSAFQPQCCEVRPMLQHRETRKSFSGKNTLHACFFSLH
jgi:hypothetical protein